MILTPLVQRYCTAALVHCRLLFVATLLRVAMLVWQRR